jgi:predicted GIY-YIG superfamily endonuclease
VGNTNNSNNTHTPAGPKFDQALGRFEYWMYVVECADGSLYTGYAKDVAARIATHNARRGAKYTKTRLPVKLAACAHFYTKERAMSAEAKFKMLTHSQKLALLDKAKAAAQQNFAKGNEAATVADAIDYAASTKTNDEANAETSATTSAKSNAAFKKLLEAELPNFNTEPLHEFIAREIVANIDEAYREFNLSLLPSVDPSRVLGVRTPALRKIASAAMKRALKPVAGSSSKPKAKSKTHPTSRPPEAPRLTTEAKTYLAALPHASFEEMQVHSFMIASLKNYDELIEQYELFIPHIDNWATCDQLATAPLMQDTTFAYNQALKWINSAHPYTVRYGIVVLMRHFLDESFGPELFDIVAQAGQKNTDAEGAKAANSSANALSSTAPESTSSAAPSVPSPPSPTYYVCMARAWFFAEAFAKQPKATLEWYTYALANGELDIWTARKAQQKAIESRKVSPATKATLKELF